VEVAENPEVATSETKLIIIIVVIVGSEARGKEQFRRPLYRKDRSGADLSSLGLCPSEPAHYLSSADQPSPREYLSLRLFRFTDIQNCLRLGAIV